MTKGLKATPADKFELILALVTQSLQHLHCCVQCIKASRNMMSTGVKANRVDKFELVHLTTQLVNCNTCTVVVKAPKVYEIECLKLLSHI